LQLATADLSLGVTAAEQTLRLQEANLADLLAEPSAAEMAAAEADVASAQANFDALTNGATAEEIAAAEANLRAAQASLNAATADLDSTESSVTESQLQAAQAAVAAAEINLQNAQEANEELTNAATDQALRQAEQQLAAARAQLNVLLAGPDEAQLAAGQSSVTSAASQVESRQAELDQLRQGATAAQLANAEAQLAQAEAALADLVTGPTVEEIAAAEAEVEQARLSLADAQEALAKATVVAPFAGLVTAVHVTEGEIAGGPVVELIDDHDLAVTLQVDEADVGALSIGQPATIILSTWPDVAIPGEITVIAPGAQTTPGSSLVVYEVRVGLGTTDLPVRAGMTAEANLVTAEREEVLLVPNRAIRVNRENGTYSVLLVTGETTQEVPVTIGLRDDENTQITGGLNAGDELMLNSGVEVNSFLNEQ
jgi:HlyD family secretion protein